MRAARPAGWMAVALGLAVAIPAAVADAPPRPATEALLSSDLALPRHTFAVEGGTVTLQGGVTRDPDVKPEPFGKGRYPTLYFVRATNATPDTVWFELAWEIDADTEFPAWSHGIPPGGFHVFYEPATGVLPRVPVEARVFADVQRKRSLGTYATEMKFAVKDRRRLLKAIPNTLSNRGVEEVFGHGRDVPILSGWPATPAAAANPAGETKAKPAK